MWPDIVGWDMVWPCAYAGSSDRAKVGIVAWFVIPFDKVAMESCVVILTKYTLLFGGTFQRAKMFGVIAGVV